MEKAVFYVFIFEQKIQTRTKYNIHAKLKKYVMAKGHAQNLSEKYEVILQSEKWTPEQLEALEVGKEVYFIEKPHLETPIEGLGNTSFTWSEKDRKQFLADNPNDQNILKEISKVWAEVVSTTYNDSHKNGSEEGNDKSSKNELKTLQDTIKGIEVAMEYETNPKEIKKLKDTIEGIKVAIEYL